MTIDIPEGYEVLGLALGEAVAQAACGKGSERHAEPGEKFSDQLIMSIPKRLGPGGECFCLGQAVKKICESRRLAPAAARAELLGAVNYIVAAWSLLGGTEGVPEERASCMASRSRIASAREDADAPRSKEELVRRIREVNPSVYPQEDRGAPLFPEGTPVECRPPLEAEWTPARYAGVDAAGFHVVERGGTWMHLSADAVRKPEDAARFQKGELVEYRDETWKPASFVCMDGGYAVLKCGGQRFRVLSFDVRPAEKS